MTKKALRKRKHNHKYEPRTTSAPNNKKKRRQRDFVAKNINSKTAEKGIENEYADVKMKNWMYLAGLVLGAIMAFCDIKDEGMEINILGFKYSGALVGIAIVLCCIYGIKNNKPKVKIG